ncbi:MAG: AAA family ATPase [Alteromonadaceae bacterium]|nr:MAG: AAA family ATPase [Alteromonadaceae bacterium]
MKYPLGVQTFSKVIQQNYVYVDKTALIYELIDQGEWYFLSRPRRFGKSLLVSTLESLFLGEKALFKGLDIANTDYAFESVPVIKLEFTAAKITDAPSLEAFISEQAQSLAQAHGISLTSTHFERQFSEIVTRLHQNTGKRVALLIDEYDKPILNTLESDELVSVKDTLNAFYAMLKTLDAHLHFVFITGVSKFSKVSVFSGMNNLRDISTHARYATLCGYTQQEMTQYFSAPTAALANKLQLTDEQAKQEIAHWYNGYCFNLESNRVYNPHSVLSLFDTLKFENYWFQTATPTFLINLLKREQTDLSELASVEVSESAFYAVEPEQLDVYAVLLQTGYLTLKSYEAPLYCLDFPNKEVKDAFYESLVANYAAIAPSSAKTYAAKMHRFLNQNNIAGFIEQLRIFLAGVPYEITLKNEKYYQSLFFVICKLLGFTAEVEVSTNKGRIDCVVETDKTIYIIEFKLQGNKDDALQQIKDKQYAQKYQGQGKKITLLGVAFDHQERNIGEWIEEGA